jgi:23S rRNA (cytosine1962-C5)-methyltransferase
MGETAVVSRKGAKRWQQGHPWIFRSDVVERPSTPAGVVLVKDNWQKDLGWALWSPESEISLRLIDANPSAVIDASWWRERIKLALERRKAIDKTCNAFRLIHGEADALPSLICDRYDKWLVVQLMSAGLETFRDEIVAALIELARPEGILARNDVALRSLEGLPRETVLLHGEVPKEVEVEEYGVKYLAAPWTGQKTGAFLDQRENRHLVGQIARGRALDCFSYHGSFALHMAKRADSVVALDSSARALDRARQNAALNGLTNIEYVETDALKWLTAAQDFGKLFDTIALDPPAFAKTKASLKSGLRGYKAVNMRAMRLLRPGGMLFTASCSFHVSKSIFLEMLEDAASDSGRRIALREFRGQPLDHPEVLNIPETGYIKAALLEALD